jgi:hypothetical protein
VCSARRRRGSAPSCQAPHSAQRGTATHRSTQWHRPTEPPAVTVEGKLFLCVT